MDMAKRLFYFYIHGSIHVAIAVLSLVLMTYHMFNLPFDAPMAGFAFFGTLFGYNFIKYEARFRKKLPLRRFHKAVAAISITALILGAVCFFLLNREAQLASLAFAALSVLYAVPFGSRGNLRSLAGIKIYIVALCWAGVTTLMPLLNAGIDLGQDAWLKFCQRFLLTIILILIFEIIDLAEDNPSLKTVPQKIGIKNTRLLNIMLLAVFYYLEFLKTYVDSNQLGVNVALVLAVGLFTMGASPERNKYYTLFWVESVPIFWLGLVYLVGGF
ncbi:hypothetical protein AM493_17465 [Flavobacterium akiainvivens]|uniref:Prenyltransferase n=2 Tax=Flavobacterium akiainvivens TaxID=1202724 RepID=A0A0N0RR09_9FLAO|nr:hypothetical protein [Flavobacterium akiainvivens]KOS07630.1 hypothetical protein AM493_17465 [Flavobacterium akiainvivens]